MKKSLLIMLIAVLTALTSCQTDKDPIRIGNREVNISVSATLPTATTKTVNSDKGGIINVDWTKVSMRYTLEIYDGEIIVPTRKGGDNSRVLYSEDASSVSFSDIKLLSGREYQFVIWADFVQKTTHTELHYTTANTLKQISQIDTYTGNDDSRDAYFASKTISVSGSTSEIITLNRPFGKLRVITTDVDYIHKPIDTNSDVVVTYATAIPSKFNAFDGTVSTEDAQTKQYTSKIVDITGSNATLAFDYIFAQNDVQTPINFSIESLGSTYDFETSSVLIERNKLTTVRGNILTKGVTLNVTISDEFGGDVTAPIYDMVATVDDVQNALTDASNNNEPLMLQITDAVSETKSISIPEAVKVENTPTIDLNFAGGITSELTIVEKNIANTDTHYKGEVRISVPNSDAGKLTVNMPSSTVYINGILSSLTASVSENTLIISKDAIVDNLTINKGNIEINGTVKSLTFATDEQPIEVRVNGTLTAISGTVPTVASFDYAIGGTAGIQTFTDLVTLQHFNQIKTVNVLGNIADYKSQIPINKPLTINGNNNSLTFTAAGGFCVKSNITFNNLIINATTPKGSAPISIERGDLTLSADRLILNQAQSGTGDGTANSGLGILIKEVDGLNNVNINIANSEINLNGPTGYQRAIVFITTKEQTGMSINLTNTNITAFTKTGMPNATYSQGIGMGKISGAKVKLINCVFDGMYYPINCAGIYPENLEMSINNSKLTGYCALNLRGSSTIFITNGSVMTGRNYYGIGSNEFATIVYNRNEVLSGTLTVDNSTIQNIRTNQSAEYMIDLRGNDDITINLINKTRLIDYVSAPIWLDYMIQEVTGTSQVNTDPTILIKGKPDVRLVQ